MTAKKAKQKPLPVLGRDDILDADDIKLEKVEVPEWGGVVYVKSMNGFERDEHDGEMEERAVAFEKEGVKGANMNFHAYIVSLMTVDANGVRLFTEEDVEALGRKSGKALHRVWLAAMRLNGLRQSDVEDLAKN